MSKLKVSEDIAKALDKFLVNNTEEELLNIHFKSEGWREWGSPILHSLSKLEMAQIALCGYEVEINPEKRILKKFLSNLGPHKNVRWVTESEDDTNFNRGILFTLSALDIKIKGIND